MTTTSRKPRADAERNKQRLLEIAKTKFGVKGASATLDEIAKTAGVGIGTLYRHFPTRESLIQEVYRKESEQLAAAARSLAEGNPAWEALRQWLLLFADYLANRQLMAEAVSDAATDLVVNAEKESGAALPLSGYELMAAVEGVVNVAQGPDHGAGARALVDALVTGLQKRNASDS